MCAPSLLVCARLTSCVCARTHAHLGGHILMILICAKPTNMCCLKLMCNSLLLVHNSLPKGDLFESLVTIRLCQYSSVQTVPFHCCSVLFVHLFAVSNWSGEK